MFTWTKIFKSLGQVQKSGKVWASFRGNGVRASHDYQKVSEEGYLHNVIVYRCVNLIAKNVALPPWILYKGDQEVLRHPLMDLLDRPNSYHTRTSFLEGLLSYLLLDGNAYVLASFSEDRVKELILLRPDRVTLRLKNQTPVAYVYQLAGQESVYPIDPETGACCILHLKLFHPLNDWYGLSPIQAAASAIDQHNAVGAHNYALLTNGARPTGAVLIPKNGRGGLTEEDRNLLKQDIRAIYQGSQNCGNILVLEEGMEWKEIGLNPKDLDFVSGKHLSMREIAQIFGVPSMLVGVPGDSTFSNYKEARFHLWEDTILPLLHMVLEQFNRWLVPLYGGQLLFSYDADQIPALSARREHLWNRIQGATFLTLNEKRAALGYGPLSREEQIGGDCLKKNALM